MSCVTVRKRYHFDMFAQNLFMEAKAEESREQVEEENMPGDQLSRAKPKI